MERTISELRSSDGFIITAAERKRMKKEKTIFEVFMNHEKKLKLPWNCGIIQNTERRTEI